MTRDDKTPVAATKDELTKQELSDEQLASIAGGQRSPHHKGSSSAPRRAMKESKASERDELM